MSLARGEGNLSPLNFTTGVIFNASGHELDGDDSPHFLTGSIILHEPWIFDNRNEEELDYSVDHAQLNNGMASFTDCDRVQ